MILLWNQLRDYLILGVLLMVGFLFLVRVNDPVTLGIRAVALEVSGSIEARLAWLGALSFTLADNRRLRQENALLTSTLGQTRVALLENQRLKEALAFKQDSTLQLLSARVVARDPFGQSNFFTIDVGRSDGVDIDMAVIDIQGILGRIVQVSPRYSRVMSYLNTEFHVPAMVEPFIRRRNYFVAGNATECLGPGACRTDRTCFHRPARHYAPGQRRIPTISDHRHDQRGHPAAKS